MPRSPAKGESGRYFFSIVIPAHNEEKYIGETLECIERLSYPKSRFEVIVVENGSTDRTAGIVAEHENGTIRSYTSEKGVSKAKNFGLAHVSSASDWIIFLDADTHLGSSFLDSLNAFLQAHRGDDLAVGATSIAPIKRTRWYASLWFSYYNIARQLLQLPFTIEIMRTTLKCSVRFDDRLQFYEDVQLIKDAKRYGKFFYFWTDEAHTSTRRLDSTGWFKTLFLWGWGGLVLSRSAKRNGAYRVVR